VDAGLVGSGEGGGEFLEGLREGAVPRLLREERVDLHEDFFEEIFGWDPLVVDAGEHVVGDLAEGGGNFVEARDVVVVVLRGGEAEAGDELGQRKMEAVELIDGHFPGLEGGLFLVFDELADHEVFAEDFLVAEAGGVDFAEAAEVVAAARELLVVGVDGVVGELIVEALVADGGGKFGGVAKAVFPDLREEVVEGLAAGFGISSGLGECGGERDEEREAERGERAEFHHRVQGTAAGDGG
jgi:hypothetical protein